MLVSGGEGVLPLSRLLGISAAADRNCCLLTPLPCPRNSVANMDEHASPAKPSDVPILQVRVKQVHPCQLGPQKSTGFEFALRVAVILFGLQYDFRCVRSASLYRDGSCR
jgi:hypothetical protein